METTNEKRQKKEPQELLDGLLKELIELYNTSEGHLDFWTVLLHSNIDFLRDFADFREHVPYLGPTNGLWDKLDHWFDEANRRIHDQCRTGGKWVPKQRMTDWFKVGPTTDL